MASQEQEAVTAVLDGIAPMPRVNLVGWGLVVEWSEPDGQRFLTRLVGDRNSPWQVKGYFHEGLNGRWPENPEQHNPGHPSGWMVIDP